MEADWEAALPADPAVGVEADNNIPNSKEASMGKAKAGRVGQRHHPARLRRTGRHRRLFRARPLLEKWARDSKILDIFEGTQQIQQLIVARRLLGLSSAELK